MTSYLVDGALDGTFQGREHGSSVSLIMVRNDEAGTGPALHRHPYDETFVIRSGAAEFTLGDRRVVGRAGEVLVAPAGVAHRFVNLGEGRLEMIDVHAAPEIVTEWLD